MFLYVRHWEAPKAMWRWRRNKKRRRRQKELPRV